jgi:hypothetical protein
MAIIINSTQVLAISTTTAKFTNPMQPGQKYILQANTDCWFLVGATGGSATAEGANNTFLKAGVQMELKTESAANGYVHVDCATGSGVANLVLIEGA